ncbi:hypothetical protein GQ457_02G016330 [Hibiscus cannabinus]
MAPRRRIRQCTLTVPRNEVVEIFVNGNPWHGRGGLVLDNPTRPDKKYTFVCQPDIPIVIYLNRPRNPNGLGAVVGNPGGHDGNPDGAALVNPDPVYGNPMGVPGVNFPVFGRGANFPVGLANPAAGYQGYGANFPVGSAPNPVRYPVPNPSPYNIPYLIDMNVDLRDFLVWECYLILSRVAEAASIAQKLRIEMKSHPHPERPDRLRAIASTLAIAGIFPGKCCPIPAREITPEGLQMIHSSEHVAAVEVTSQMFSSYFTPDTYANEHSAQAARLAAGLCADFASAIFSERVKNGFALVRPPGHHAGVRQAMGFCLHNNAAVAALAAQAAGAKKVLIVDWVLYISLHRHEGGKFYPGTGAALEVGSKGAEGYCVNIPWSRGGVGDNDYIFAFQHVVLPIASKFAPDFTIISAGFDAARGDITFRMLSRNVMIHMYVSSELSREVTPAGYAQMTHMLSALSGGKLLVILEGGYNLRSISSSATSVIKVLLGESRECEPENMVPSKAGLHTVLEVLKIQMNYWPNLSSSFEKLQSQWGMYSVENKEKQAKRRRVFEPPLLLSPNKLAAYFVAGSDIGKFTVMSINDDRTLNKTVHFQPPSNLLNMNEMASLWEMKIGRMLPRVTIAEQDLLQRAQEMRIPQSVVTAITHDIFINGCQINFSLDKPTDAEVCSLYPDTRFRTVVECFDDFVKKISDKAKTVSKPVTASNSDMFVPAAKPEALPVAAICT